MKFKLTAFILLYTTVAVSLFSECVLVPLTLNERVNAASLIVEARVESKNAHWNADNSMIYTLNRLQISKVYKGYSLLNGSSLDMVTQGGTVGYKAIKVNPELDTEPGEIGIFMLVQKDGEWVSESGVQGFIRIDKHNGTASDVFNSWPPQNIEQTITQLTGIPIRVLDEKLTRVVPGLKRAAVSISSISPKVLTAGTGSVLTIIGNNFNNIRDTSSVQFRNADFGTVVYTKALNTDYITWNDTLIQVKVRNKAGTGKIRVVVGGNGNALAADTLFVSYSHLNVVIGDTIAYQTRQIGMNANNGITWKMNSRFFDSTGARGAFLRSLERWRCGTYINWDTLGKVNYSTIKSDNVNLCAWDTNSIMPSGTLAQCYSYWNGCFNPDLKWFVSELDIRFRIKPTGSTNWEFGTGNASANEFHFESVATHELGHGHQLDHVISSPAVMHFGIANGQTKPSLNSNDIAAGNFVISKSNTVVCGRNAHIKLNAGNCAIVAPKADFTVSALNFCKNETTIFKDSSAGNISSYSWNFGIDATPANATGPGPHNIKYSNGGNKTITLSISTIAGTLQKSKTIAISNDIKMVPDFAYTAAEKGKVSFINLSSNSISDIWYFGDGDSSVQVSPEHVYASGGTYPVRLISTNSCNTSDTVKYMRIAFLNFGASVSEACIGEPVMFIDSSDNLAASWNWAFPAGTPSSAVGKGPHLVKYNIQGIKQVNLTIGIIGGQNQSHTKTGIVTIGSDTFTRAEFGYSLLSANQVAFNNRSAGSNLSFKWYFGDGDSSTEIHPVHTYTSVNGQSVKLIVSGNCGIQDTIRVIDIQTGILQKGISERFSFYPNPSRGILHFVLPQGQEALIDISEMSGKTVAVFSAKTGSTADIKYLKAGLYILRATLLNGDTIHGRLIVD